MRYVGLKKSQTINRVWKHVELGEAQVKEAAVKRHGMEEKKKKAMNPRNSRYAEKKFKKKKLYMPDKTIQSFVSADSNL